MADLDDANIQTLDNNLQRHIDVCVFVFFFQAEDGIRDLTVTGVQTCALPILKRLFLVMCALSASVGFSTAQNNRGQERLVKEVRHELVMLPYYNVFDNLSYRVDGSTVTLMGQVTRPTLKSDAERVVKGIEGVEKVVNNIEVLPVSPNDDRIRMAVYRAIYGQSALQRDSLPEVPPILIIVNNGNVTLEGVVASEADKNIA